MLTRSLVFMDIYGRDDHGVEESDSVKFFKANKSSFETGSVDRFTFDIKDVGKPYKIRIGHDGAGFGAGWHLDRIVMINQRTKEAFEFPCKRWLASVSRRRVCVFGDGIAGFDMLCVLIRMFRRMHLE